MKKLILILGAGQMISGIFFGIEAASAIHQILAYAAFGMGSICLSIGVLIGRVEENNDLSAKKVTLLEAQARR